MDDHHALPVEAQKPRPHRRPKFEIEQKMEQIEKGLLHGATPNELIEELGLPRRTLFRYMARIQKEKKNYRMKHSDTLLYEFYNRQMGMVHEAMKKYHTTEDPRFLFLAFRIDQSLFSRLQSAGFIPHNPSKVVVTPEDELNSWTIMNTSARKRLEEVYTELSMNDDLKIFNGTKREAREEMARMEIRAAKIRNLKEMKGTEDEKPNESTPAEGKENSV